VPHPVAVCTSLAEGTLCSNVPDAKRSAAQVTKKHTNSTNDLNTLTVEAQQVKMRETQHRDLLSKFSFALEEAHTSLWIQRSIRTLAGSNYYRAGSAPPRHLPGGPARGQRWSTRGRGGWNKDETYLSGHYKCYVLKPFSDTARQDKPHKYKSSSLAQQARETKGKQSTGHLVQAVK
jgi:hypothetical protein